MLSKLLVGKEARRPVTPIEREEVAQNGRDGRSIFSECFQAAPLIQCG